MADTIPKVSKEPASSGPAPASVVWLVPIAALVVALFVAFTTYSDRGPLVQISFENASGIVAGETEVRFRNVAVGVVEKVSFNDDLTRVLVDVHFDVEVAPYIDDDASFWIVSPQVTTSGVTGLDTVLSGVYLEGSWDTEASGTVYEIEGLEEAPLLTAYREGTVIELRSSRPSGLAENTPILYKGIEVGRLGPARISQDGGSVFANAIIYAPHDRLITTATRFWDTSGFSISIGPNGANLDFSSLASLISGGITFGTLVSGGEPLREGLVFDVFPAEGAARNSIFEESSGQTISMMMIFDENVSGLAAGADVEWRGVRIGQVVNVTGVVDEEDFGDARVRLLASVEIQPSRFGLGGEPTEEAVLAYLGERVDVGLRARLASASIITGGLKIELIIDDDAAEAELIADAEPFPRFPVTESEIADVSATAEGVFERVNALPVEDLLDSAIAFLDNATALVASPELRDTPAEILGLLSDARGVIGSEEVQNLPEGVGALVSDLQLASADLRGLLAQVQEAGMVDRLLAAVDEAGAAAEAANAALQGIPELTAEVTALAQKANALPLETLLGEVTTLASDLGEVTASASFKALPTSAQDAVSELTSLLSALTEADTAASLNAALTDASEAATAIEASVEGVPALVARLDQIAANAEEVELGALATELESVLATASELFGEASEFGLPEVLAAALDEAEAALAELRAGGIIETANATLASARDAAVAIEGAAEDLPALVERINATLTEAQSTLSDYGGDSTFARETSSAMREIERAAKALSDLARAIERNPNSLLLGR
ncbi:MAG: MlaD family protein [Rhodobacteraceae bacterium]|nr:MlaD family protein [Paracoccaceae bacterium]